MKLLRSLLRIATTVCLCMAIIAIVTSVVRPQVLRDWPGDYAADPVVQLTGNFTPIKLARGSSGTLPVVQSEPAETNLIQPSDSRNSGWVLAESQPAPVEAPAAESTNPEFQPVDSESLDLSIPARPSGDEFESKNDAPAVAPGGRPVPESYTIRAEPQGRVRIEGENGYSLEASEITLENAPANGESHRTATVSGNAGDHTLPEFLRGRELPPLVPGQKVVTVHVPVDNWVDLSAGDLVDVRSELRGTGVNSDAGVEGTIHIDELERVEIYALPGIAPENSDTVPVCLKVNAPQARLLIKLRASKTPVRLMVVKSAHAAADPYRASAPTPTATRVPLRDFAEPTPARTPPSGNIWLPEAGPTAVVDPIDLRGRDDFPAPAANGPTPVPESDLPADEPTPIATAEPQPASAARLPDESLPAIEPSEVGTVIRLDGSTLRMTADGVQVVESELRIRRVRGFDPKIIRISALRPTLLKIEALAQGQTSFRVDYDSAALAGMGATGPAKIDVEVGPKLINLQLKTYAPAATTYNAPRATMEARPATSGQSPQDEAVETLSKLYPNSGLEFVWLRDALVLRGWVVNAGEIPQIIEIAEQYAPRVFNQIAVKLPERDRPVTLALALPVRKTLGDGEWEQQRVDVVRLGTAQTPATLIVEDAALTRIINEELVELAVTKDQAALLGWLGDEPLVVVEHLLDREAAQRLIHSLPRHESTNAGDDGKAGASIAPFAPDQSITLSRECKVTLNPGGKLDLASCASCHQASAPLDAATGPANDPLRDDIRSLHDDVRKLITLLERRAAVTPPEHGGPFPQPQDAQRPLNTVEPAKPAGPVEPQTESQAPPSPPESTTDAKRPNSGDREMAEFLDRTWWLIGFRFTPLAENAPQLRDRFVRGGLLVEEVRPDSPAAKASIEAGDAIIGVRNWETTDGEDLRYAINKTVEDGVWDVKFHFVRGGRRLSTQVAFETVELQPPPHGTAADDETRSVSGGTAAARASGLNPQAAARKKLLDEIGRVILRRDYPRALELAGKNKAADLVAEFAAMEKIGPENVPVLVVATAPWSPPCQKLQPLLRQLQNDGYGLVILDSDDATDAELIQQLKIGAFPTLACVVDGSKKAELVGVFSHTEFDRFANRFGDMIQKLLEKIESDTGASTPGIEVDIPAATSQTVRQSHGDVRAVDFNRTFNFFVGFAH